MTTRTLEENLGQGWYNVLAPEFDKDYMKTIAARVLQTGDKLRPHVDDIFNAYRSTPLDKVRVVIVGQDPYPGNEAHGLSFSSKQPSIPPSLRIIFKELERSGMGLRTSPNLQDWADQGVLMLNSVLTTTYRIPNAHKDWGWQPFTKKTLHTVNNRNAPVVYMVWGEYARNLVLDVLEYSHMDESKLLVLTSCHPQAENYSGGKKKFTGNDHFVKANAFLQQHGLDPIKWV